VNLLFGVVCGLTGAICWGLVDSCATVASRRVGTLLTSTGMQVAALVPLVVIFVASGEPIPTDGPLVVQTMVMGLISAVGSLLTYQAFRLGPVAVVSPVISAYGGLSVVLAVVLLGEAPRPLQAWGVLVATIGVGLAGVVLDRDSRQIRLGGRGVPYGVGALFVWAVTVVGFAGPIRGLGWLPALTVSRLASTAALVVATGISVKRSGRTAGLQPAPPSRRWAFLPRDRTAARLIIAMGLLDVFGFAVWSIGLDATAAWLVGITGSFAPIISMAFGVVVLRERLRPNQWLGVAIVFSSIILIGAP
jgi:drug/metabolite transporter (DMT)-like permease